MSLISLYLIHLSRDLTGHTSETLSLHKKLNSFALKRATSLIQENPL